MPREIRVPRLNANDDEILLQRILVREGERVSAGQELFVIETTKATYSIEAEEAGFVLDIAASAPGALPVGALLCSIGDSPSGTAAPAVAVAPAEAEKPGGGSPTAKQRLQARRARPAAGPAPEPAAPVSPPPSGELPWVAATRDIISGLGEAPDGGTWQVPLSSGVAAGSPGLSIGRGVVWGDRSRIRARRIFVGDGAVLGSDVEIEADSVYLGGSVRIGGRTRIVAGELVLGEGTLVGEEVLADIAGGRSAESRLLVGEGCLISSRCLVNACREVLMEPESALSPGAMIFTHSFWQSVLEGSSARFNAVRLGREAWLGAGAQILPGVTVGPGSIIMSNSTVVEDVPPSSLVAGIPARIVRRNIAKRLEPAVQMEVLRRLLPQFLAHLEYKGCGVRPLPAAEAWEVKPPSGDAQHLFLVENAANPPPAGPGALVILVHGRLDAPPGGAVFALGERQFTGSAGRLAHELRNFLRRQGIRLRPFAWNSGHEGGL